MAKQANYLEIEEIKEMFLMAYHESFGQSKTDVWFLDSGCGNHMCGDPSLFNRLEDGFQRTVRGESYAVKCGW